MIVASFLGGDDEAFVFAILTLFVMHAATKFAFAFDATRALNDDKRSSVLELLLATPLTAREIADGQAAAFHLDFRRHVRHLLHLTIILELTMLLNPGLHLRGDDFLFVSSFVVGMMIWTWSDYRTGPWLGISHALTQTTHLKATLRTFFDMLLLPWAPYFLVLFFMAENNVSEEFATLVTVLWAVSATVYEGMRAIRKRAHVIQNFRNLLSGTPLKKPAPSISDEPYSADLQSAPLPRVTAN